MQLRELKEKLDAGAIPLEKFVITKQLTKRPEDYPDASNQPHVQVCSYTSLGNVSGTFSVHMSVNMSVH